MKCDKIKKRTTFTATNLTTNSPIFHEKKYSPKLKYCQNVNVKCSHDIARDPKDTLYKYIKVHILSPPQIY